jgi:hypothetical protein
LAVYPCVLVVGLAKVFAAISLIFIGQIKGVWQ